MTKEEALNFKVTRYEDDDKAVTEKVVKTPDIRFLINKIYDDLESRTCVNCKYNHIMIDISNKPTYNFCSLFNLVGFEVGCNRFKPKENE